MDILQAIIMGLVQGLTEFLPVSSSAHLVFADHFLHLRLSEAQTVSFDVLLHLGTLLAVLYYFRADVWQLLKGAAALVRAPKKAWRNNPFSRIFALLMLGTIPAGIAGLTLQDFFSAAFQNVPGTAALLFLTAAMLIWISRRKTGSRTLKSARWKDALIIGVFQALAILPGISRSGATITAGLLRGMDRESAPRFSFLLSIPIIFAGGLFDFKDTLGSGFSLPPGLLIAGFVAAAISGYIAVVLLLGIVRRGRLHYFAYYCIVAGAGMLLYWSLLVPKVEKNALQLISRLPGETYTLRADNEFGPVEMNKPLQFIVPVKSAMLPVRKVQIVLPAQGHSHSLSLRQSEKPGVFLLDNYPMRPLHAPAEQPAEEVRDVWLVLYNSWGIRNEFHLRIRVVPPSAYSRTAMAGKSDAGNLK